MATTTKRGGILAVVTLGMLLTGCSVTTDDEPGRSAASTPPEPSPTDSEDPGTGEESTPPSSTPTATEEPSSPEASPGSPEAVLIGAADLPQLNDESPWTEQQTTVPGQRSFGLCQQFDLLSIGAMSIVERTYRAGTSGRDTAGMQVAEFPDAQTAVRAAKVLEAWHRDCRDQVRGRNVRIRPIQDVAVTTGKGWEYLVSYTRGGTGRFHSFGVTWSGTRMALLRIDHVGQDHNYEPGEDPMELAVKAASAKMG